MTKSIEKAVKSVQRVCIYSIMLKKINPALNYPVL